MMRAQAHTRIVLALMEICLFVLLFPILDLFTHPISVLHGAYEPLVVRLTDAYWKTRLISVSIVSVPLILVALVFLFHTHNVSFPNALALLLVPFLVAVTAQYLICVQLDKYVQMGLSLREMKDYVFQVSFMSGCLFLSLIYAVICISAYFIVGIVRRKLTRH